MKLHYILIPFILIVLVFFVENAFSQDAVSENYIRDINKSRINTGIYGMSVLGSWAAGNFIYSGVSLKGAEGAERYFHIMNIGWNAVNFAIATGGMVEALVAKPGSFNLDATITMQRRMETILLVNTGLDVAYMGTGLLLTHLADSSSRREVLLGFGNSLMLQGGFLLVFDLILYAIHRSKTNRLMDELKNVRISFNQISYTCRF